MAQESTSHLQQVRAYLSAWLTNGSTLPINAIDCEFILQGIVESLLVDYCDSVFGEDASMYRHQKAIDSVVNLEKSGFSFSLSEPYFPESYDRFTPYFRQYFENKSLAVFQMINTRLGGRAIMRTVYQSLIKSPPLYAPSGSAHFPGYHSRHARGASDLNSGSMNQYMANEQFGTSLMYLGLVPSPGHSNSDPGTPHYDRYSDGIMSPAYPYMNPSSPSLDSYPQSPYAYGSGASPNPYAAASMSPNPYGTPYMPSSSPNPYGAPYIPSQSPNPYAAPYMPSQSPNPYGVPYLLPGDSASPRPRSRSNSFDFPTIRPRSSSVDSTGAYLQVPSHALKAPDSFPVPASINPSALKRQNTVTSETSGGMTSMGEQVSEGTIISLDTFISSIQLISGTDSDLDDNFLDTYICNSGCQLIRFGVFVGIKIEGRPQMMTIVADSILLKGGKIIQDVPAEDLQRSDIRLRICELRDDTVTEPMMKLTAGIEVPYQQQLFTRPGRKGGRPRKSQGGEDGMPSSLSLLHSTAESLKDPLEIARDREEAVRYALIDPQFSYIIGEVNIISSDAALVEQLYAEVDKFDLLRHIQALRSLARVAPLSYPLSVAANSTRLNPSSLESSKYALKLKAMADCLLCISLANNPQKTISSGHSMYVRMEAAFALAHWQNEHAPSYVNAADAITLGGPDTVVNPITENLDDLDEGWIGLKHLLEATHELYLDNSTLLPTSCDLTDEQQMQLRCTVLQAISTIRSTNGLTPPKVVNTLLLFTEFHMNQPVPYVPPASHDINDEDVTHRKAVSDTRHTRSSSSNGTSRRTNAMTKETLYLYDDSHYVATLMLTLRNMRFDSHNKRNPTDPLFRVCDQAVKCLKTDLAIAKAKARVARNPESEGDFFLPVLPLSGAVSASALACIGEMDSQLVTIVDKDKDRKQTGNFQFIVLGCVQFVLRVPGGGEKLMVGPTGTGSLSSIRYTDFFVAEGAKLAFTQVPQQAQDLDHDSSAGSRMTSRDFSLYPPSVRLCALEAFIRLCLTQASLLSEKIKIFRNSPEAHAQAQTQAQAQAQGLKPTAPKISPPHPVFIPAIIEAVLYVVNNDTDRRTRRGAALTFLECMQDRPSGRAAMEALASGDSWSFIGHSDREALTRFESSTYYIARPGTRKLSGASVYRDLFAHADGPQARQMVRNWWNCIAQHSDEVVRSLLLRAWIYVFGATAPLCMTIGDKKKQADMIAQVAELKGKLWGAEAAHLLPDRLSVRAPSECFRISEMVCIC